ncbi:hypothetical protein [Gluconobacter cerinus]|uniref:hypothetical protein n=1 Tax=Gluconobacter cerinus TaxID=38307 RepID=UPI001B8B3018|nr:hypothetical protein [Gluconobacter cerinus]MBS1024049.1 hypothetical protein [Gluconobacter cerinus]
MTEEGFTPTISAHNVRGEVGVRITPTHHSNVQAAAFIIDFASEFSYDGDADVTSPGPASRREGVEVQSICLT